MLLKRVIIFIFYMQAGSVFAQFPCSTLGQTPSTAFPVCGTSVFLQDSVPLCRSSLIYVPGCSASNDSSYMDRNPFWYKFTCFKSGTLSFTITPNIFDEDYDWQLYDITGHNPNDVFTDSSLIVTGNWAGTYGPTGASDTGLNYIQCASAPEAMLSAFANSPLITQGHNYLLLVSHFSDSQHGYALSFGGGTAVITDTLPPHIALAQNTTCDGSQVLVKLNKRMKCSSLASDGSDFILSPPAATITSAVGFGCATGFDMDSVLITFSNSLPFGNYNLVAKNGSDSNTLLDLCDNEVPPGESVPFSVLSPTPVPMDSLINNKCSTDSLLLIFPNNIKCNSVAADGSDFIITGPYPVTISSALPINCVSGLTKQIAVYFNTSVNQPGNFKIILQYGSDGNTILSECDTPSVAGSQIAFVIAPKPIVDFSFPPSICLPNAVVSFSNLSTITDGTENSFRYLWNFGDTLSGSNNFSTLKTPTHIYTDTGPFNVNLQVTSNMGCTNDTSIVINTIHPQPITAFELSKTNVCLGDAIFFSDSTNSMDGITVQWNWDLGNGITKDSATFTYTYPNTNTYNISLFTINSHGCKSNLLTKQLTVNPYPVANAGPDRVMLEGGRITIDATATGVNQQYTWWPPLYLDNTTVLKPNCIDAKDDITYTFTVTTAGGCSATDEMFVDVLKIPRIPNTFSPNNDGINDFWEIQFLNEYKNNHTQVFTRAGQLVFECKGVYKPWNGTYKGKPLPIDTYFYIIEPGDGREPFTGYVTIIK
ncbi:MAG: gliding motility-associated C-terminal domain-containing protein [Ferruginibacter sp.]|nr:gliding motility-associated C-terminal domain-containing protein [Ferruginibacter sp.]